MSVAGSASALRVGAASDRGRVRGENQDRISRFRSAYGEAFLVVDGMGGHGDGGRAAEIAVTTLEIALARAAGGVDEAQAMARAADLANRELLQRSADTGEGARKMGATLVMALIEGSQARVAHAGDCRAYLVRDDALRPLTRDHTLVQQMVDADLLSAEEARDHPDASVVTRALGQEESLDLEIGEPLTLEPGDRLLLCSDGLTGYLEESVIADSLAESDDVQGATERLIALALGAGGEDNVSVQLIAVAESSLPARTGVPEAPMDSEPSQSRKARIRSTLPSADAISAKDPSSGRSPSRAVRGFARAVRTWLLVVGAVAVLIAVVWVWHVLRAEAGPRRRSEPDQAQKSERILEPSDDVAPEPLPADPGAPEPGALESGNAVPQPTQTESDDEPDLPAVHDRES